MVIFNIKITQTNLKCVHHTMEELDDKQRRHLALYDGHEVDAMSEHVNEVVVRGRDHRRHVLRFRCPFQRLEKVIANGSADHTLPVLLQKDIPRCVNQEKAVDHGGSWKDKTTNVKRKITK